MRTVLLCAALLAAGCTAEERADIARDVSAYNGAPVASDRIGPVAVDTAVEVAERAGSPAELLAYLGGLVATVVVGWVGRKFIKRKYAAPK